MQVSTHVKEAIDEVVLYCNLDHKPFVSDHFAPPAVLEAFAATIDRAFCNVFNQPCGYYQLKRFAATCDEVQKLLLIEDISEYRMTDDPALRLQR